MRKSNPNTKNQKSKIQCLEVLIPKNFIVNSGHNLHWTLSVYSLENQPVKKNESIHNSEIFHFMVYDWNRTIKELLEDQKIPYSIIRFFTPVTIYSNAVHLDDLCLHDSEKELFAALESLPSPGEDVHKIVARELFSLRSTENAALVFEEKRH